MLLASSAGSWIEEVSKEMDVQFRAELLELLRNDDEFKELLGRGGGSLWEQVKALEKNYVELEKKCKALEIEKNDLADRLRAATADKNNLADRLRMATADKNNLAAELKAADDRRRALETDNTKLKDRLQTTETDAAQRFPRGWELFQRYHTLSEKVRRNLDVVFRDENDFASFICGAAQSQEGELNIIWTVAQHSLNSGDVKDTALLRQIFEYTIELVNISKSRPQYAILETDIGDEYDYNRHTLFNDSSAQGRVVEIKLPGYKNIFNVERIIKKSIVRVE